MNIKIKFGNLVKEKATFIVNASNTELMLGSGVSHAFSEHCGGASYQKELNDVKKRVGDIEQGDVVISGSGTAKNFQYALHIAVMNYSNVSKPAHPTYMQMQHALNSMISIIKEKVQSQGIQNPSVVIPLFGCGVGGLKKEKMFMLIKSTFQKIDFDLDLIIYFHNKKDYYEFYSKV
ncbi:macro domain-containing protein [Sulfurimonas sp.]|uniref:macro domain-containing protein n=1 Tax=Sulfurimonas sp. TaxID=2022749 RepID=UPI003567DCA7